ncbi:hypothetical protein HRO21_003742 [Vibrio parahaemolyticus]|nr:hypothetical protein [Vibrio parahaemolyticus]
MKYEILIPMLKDIDSGIFDSAEDRFQSALHCSKSAIESILYDYPVEIEANRYSITINVKQPGLFTIDELKELLLPAFRSESGETFPEFGVIKVQVI